VNQSSGAALADGNKRQWQDLNFEFHRTLMELSRNPRAQQYFDLLHDQLKRALLLTLPFRGNQHQSVADHDELLAAMLAGQPDHARAIAQRHRRRVRLEVLSAVRSVPWPSI
jgi:DNA-binding GntR family transcriptional regulator